MSLNIKTMQFSATVANCFEQKMIALPNQAYINIKGTFSIKIQEEYLSNCYEINAHMVKHTLKLQSN